MSCNNIVALMHGTTHDNLLEILKTNRIIAKKSPMGINRAVSTYPILDCDLGHELNLLNFWGTCKIFMKNNILKEKDWKLSIQSDVSADWNYMPYNIHNISTYMSSISPQRHNVWHTHEHTNEDHMEDDNVKLYGGELAFTGDLENIENHILFVTIEDSRPHLIEKVMSYGVNVVIFPSNHIFNLRKEWFQTPKTLEAEQTQLQSMLPALYTIVLEKNKQHQSESQKIIQHQHIAYQKARKWWENRIKLYGETSLRKILGNTYNITKKAYDNNDIQLVFRIDRCKHILRDKYIK
jgi:hypothetical protein